MLFRTQVVHIMITGIFSYYNRDPVHDIAVPQQHYTMIDVSTLHTKVCVIFQIIILVLNVLISVFRIKYDLTFCFNKQFNPIFKLKLLLVT